MKVFNDPIHGHIQLEEFDIKVIDTPQFQRLRDLKQMGVSYYVFPGATHNRFEHSIGVCHLAGLWVDSIRKEQPELKITDNDYKCVRIAGLCHDLGHGPFSHLFDTHVSKITDKEYCHEMTSERMLEYLLKDNPDVNINENELRFIKDLIHGEPRSNYPQSKKLFLFEIVANKRNSIDVDKFDYLLRDSYNIGMKCSFDPSRLLKFSKVINNQICFHQKEAFNVYQLFHCRYSLFKQVYTHKVSTAIEFMILDIFKECEDTLNLAARVSYMKEYSLLNDSVLLMIEQSNASETAKARKILHRLRKRDLYRCVDALILPFELQDHPSIDKITANAIVAACESSDVATEDVIVQKLVLSYAMKEKNPVDSVRFYSKNNPDESLPLRKEHVSGLIPENYKEITIRIYCRRSHLSPRIQFGFRKLLEKINRSLDDETLLEAESSQDTNNAGSLKTSHNQLGPEQIADSFDNPFLKSPSNGDDTRTIPLIFSPTKSPLKSPGKSPSKRLECNEILKFRIKEIESSSKNLKHKSSLDEHDAAHKKSRINPPY